MSPSNSDLGGIGARIGRSLPVLRDRDLLTAAVLIGVIGGLAEASATAVRYWMLHLPVGGWVAGELYWLAPLAACTTLVVMAGVAILLRRVMGRFGVPNAVTLFVLVVVGVFSFGRSVHGIHDVALLLLGAGLAFQILRIARSQPAGFARWVRLGAVLGSVAVCLWAATQPYRTALRNRSPQAQGPVRAAEPGRPNVILIVWDTARARSLSLYGYERNTTPNLDEFAKQSAVFDGVVTPAPWTLPAHVSLLTGLYHHEHSADRESPLGPEAPTLAERLGALGYQTAGFVANDYWLGRGFGVDRGFQWYEDQEPISAGGIPGSWWLSRKLQPWLKLVVGNYQSNVRISAELLDNRFLQWLDRKDDRPFFAFLNLFDAHEPYLPPGGFGFKFSSKTPPRFYWEYTEQTTFSATELQDMRDAYDSCLYYLDYQFGILLKQLEERALMNNTVIILTADHGETLGEHQPDLMGHETSVYDDVLSVPLVVYFPSRFQPGLRHGPVSLADIPVSVMDIVGAGGESPFPGKSIVSAALPGGSASDQPRMLLSQGNPAAWHKGLKWPMSKGPLFSLVDGTLHYIVNAEHTEQLFDLRADPWEREDLSTTERGKAALPRFRDELRSRGVGAPTSSVIAAKGK